MKILMLLGEIGKNDTLLAGGKGAQLGELKKSGFNVPEGFIITTEFYKMFVEKTGLSKAIQEILSNLDVENTNALEEASKKIQSLIISTDLSEDAENDVIKAYEKLNAPVAVRSSATAEDQKEASFAGQMATFLNVAESNLIESVKKCIASLFTARAIYYRAQKKIDHMKVSMAVVVQKMVNSKRAGVAFSLNPVSNNLKEIVIEAASGLGEAVVGGQTVPDNYVVDKETFETKQRRIRSELSVCNEQEIKQIAIVVKKIEEHYKFPQDIEWAIDENKLYVLQARPVTTLQVKRKPVWKKILAREYGVQYAELSIKCLSPLNKRTAPAAFYEQVYVPEDGNEACYIDETKWDNFISALKEKYIENPDNYEGFENRFMKAGSEYMETAKIMAKNDQKNKSKAELKEIYMAYLKKNLTYGPFIWMQFIINNFFAEKAKEIITDKLGKGNKNLYDYIEVALKPEKKAASIQLNEIANKWEALNEAEQQSIYENFKWLPCLDIHNKPWTKEQFFMHLNDFKKAEKKSLINFETLVKEIKPSEKEKQVLDIAKRLSYLKDLKDDFRRQGIFYCQKLFGEIANRMGIDLEDMSYVTEEEIIGFLDKGETVSNGLISERRKGFAIYFNEHRKIECKSGKDVESALNELGIIISERFSEEIKGTPASPGRAKGIVTVVKGVSDLAKVKKGDVLVAVTTHPDYVPTMQRAVAIVTEEGGITSYAAIVARELGLPCIVGTMLATKALKDGDIVEVDAASGRVRKLR